MCVMPSQYKRSVKRLQEKRQNDRLQWRVRFIELQGFCPLDPLSSIIVKAVVKLKFLLCRIIRIFNFPGTQG